MNTRIKMLREELLKISQADFAEMLNLKRNSISLIEVGKRNPSDRTVSDICEKFNVSENWLRTGTGEVFVKTPSSTMEQLKKEFNLDDFAYSFVYEYLKLGEGKRDAVRDFFYSVMSDVSASETTDFYADVPKTPEELEKKFPPVDIDSDQKEGTEAG